MAFSHGIIDSVTASNKNNAQLVCHSVLAKHKTTKMMRNIWFKATVEQLTYIDIYRLQYTVLRESSAACHLPSFWYIPQPLNDCQVGNEFEHSLCCNIRFGFKFIYRIESNNVRFQARHLGTVLN